MHGLSERDENGGDTKLVVGQVFDDVGVEAKHGQFVGGHDAGKELHEEDFVFEGEALVIAIQDVVQLFSEGLRVMKELKGGEIRSRGSIGSFCAVLRRSVSTRCEE